MTTRRFHTPTPVEEAQIRAGIAADPDAPEMTDEQLASLVPRKRGATTVPMIFPAVIKPDGDGFAVSFPDIPEALTCGDTFTEAVDMAEDALATAMDFYLEDRRPVPDPSPVKHGQVAIELRASVTRKVRKLNSDLAKLEIWDAAENMHDAEDCVLFLQAVVEEGGKDDSALVVMAAQVVARALRRQSARGA